MIKKRIIKAVILISILVIGVLFGLANKAEAEWEILVDLEPATIGNLEVDRPDLRCYSIYIIRN